MKHLETNLKSLLENLKKRGELPKNIDASKVGERYWFVCHDANESQLVSENSTTGFASDPNVALLKALSERAERSAFKIGYKNGLKACNTNRSDGFAAYPSFYENSNSAARESALSEAIERYVWSTWWDDEDIDSSIDTIGQFTQNKEVLSHLAHIESECEIAQIFVIQPKVVYWDDRKVIILFAQLNDGGFISGGACGADTNQVLLRSLDELFRHGLAMKKIKMQNIKSTSFYESRLAYFGSGKGNHLVTQRLKVSGKKIITLPELEIDESISHSLEGLFAVHRCYFKNQPAFIGGEMERMCL